jgi:hypothetical protein
MLDIVAIQVLFAIQPDDASPCRAFPFLATWDFDTASRRALSSIWTHRRRDDLQAQAVPFRKKGELVETGRQASRQAGSRQARGRRARASRKRTPRRGAARRGAARIGDAVSEE